MYTLIRLPPYRRVLLEQGTYAWYCLYHCRALLQIPQLYVGDGRIPGHLVRFRLGSDKPWTVGRRVQGDVAQVILGLYNF